MAAAPAPLQAWQNALVDLHNAYEAAVVAAVPLADIGRDRGAEAAAIGLLRVRAGGAGGGYGADEVALAIEVANILKHHLGFDAVAANNAAIRAANIFNEQLQLLEPPPAAGAGVGVGRGAPAAAAPPVPRGYRPETLRRARDAAILSIRRVYDELGARTPKSRQMVTFFRNFSQMVIEGDNKRALYDPNEKGRVVPPTQMGLDEEEDDGPAPAPVQIEDKPLSAMTAAEAWSEYERGRFEIHHVLERARCDALAKIRLIVLRCLTPTSKIFAKISKIRTDRWFNEFMSDELEAARCILYDLAHVHYNRSKSSAPDAETSITNLRHTNTIEMAAMQMLQSHSVIGLIATTLNRRI